MVTIYFFWCLAKKKRSVTLSYSMFKKGERWPRLIKALSWCDSTCMVAMRSSFLLDDLTGVT
jgi:hypothetical protein